MSARCEQAHYSKRHVAAKRLQSFWRKIYAGRLMRWLRERHRAANSIIVRCAGIVGAVV